MVPTSGDGAGHEVPSYAYRTPARLVWLPHAELHPELELLLPMLLKTGLLMQNTTALTEAISEGQGHPKRLVS